jgi:hypothetical protein
VLDKAYNEIRTIHLFDSDTKRISKDEKRDFETAAVITKDGKDYLLVIGSASRKKRRKAALIALNDVDEKTIDLFTLKEFIDRLEEKCPGELNIEGSAQVGDYFILTNRSNHSNPTNYFIITEADFWREQKNADIVIKPLELNTKGELLGVSELCYIKSNDLLLLALSSENTSNAYDDGVIGDSYLGWISSISKKIKDRDLMLTGCINLMEVSEVFKTQKIEGLCVESIDDVKIDIHLISDNDMGDSHLFKIQIENLF